MHSGAFPELKTSNNYYYYTVVEIFIAQTILQQNRTSERDSPTIPNLINGHFGFLPHPPAPNFPLALVPAHIQGLLSWPPAQCSFALNMTSSVLSHDATVLTISFFFFFLVFYYSWLTMLCQFPLYSKVTQLYIYIFSFSHNIFCHVPSQVIGYNSPCMLYSRTSLLIHSKCNICIY